MKTLADMWRIVLAWLTCTKPPWTLEAEAAEAEAEAEAERAADAQQHHDRGAGENAVAAADLERHSGRSDGAHSISSSAADALRLKRAKRRLAAVGVGGVYVVWCVRGPAFVYLFGFAACRCGARQRPHAG
jgi:hypothetical protein